MGVGYLCLEGFCILHRVNMFGRKKEDAAVHPGAICFLIKVDRQNPEAYR